MHHVAIDIGASGGTVYLGHVTSTDFDVREVYRFENSPVEVAGRYVWDVDALREEIITGLRSADEVSGGVDVAGIDTWGLDFGLSRDGELLRNPVSYRDPAAIAGRERLFDQVDQRRLFEATGITHWNTPNTLWQLYTIATEEPSVLERADSLLMMPQLLSASLGGEATGEVTIGSTTQMVDPRERTWAMDLLEDLSLPTDLLPPLEEPGRRLGPVSDDVAADLSTTPELVSTASHDTAAAVAGLPITEDAAFLNTGSWLIAGVERDEPVLTDEAFDLSLANELGVDGSVRLLKNVNGFFLLEQCREAWNDAGEPVAYDTLLKRAREAAPRSSLIDPDADAFGIEGSMPDQIRDYCRRTDQSVPVGQGEIVRCLVDSLVAKAALVFDQLSTVTGADFDAIALGGGGARNDLFCQSLADASDRAVRAGPVEATAIGNLLTQAIAVGTIPDVATGRDLIRAQFGPVTYEPTAPEDWHRTRDRMVRLESL